MSDFSQRFIEAAKAWQPGELSAFTFPIRGAGKSAFQDLYMCRPMPTPELRGTTTNAIVTDEVGASTVTIDKMRKAIGDIQENYKVWFDEAVDLDGFSSLLKQPKIPRTVKVGDEWIFLNDIKREFKDPEFPEADTYVVLEKLDQNDPRNPNPAAGTQKKWYIAQGLKRVVVKNMTAGEHKGYTLHAKTIAAIKKQRENAAYEAFLAHEKSLRVAAANAAHLRSLPDYGGF